jgi:hypothetical protein
MSHMWKIIRSSQTFYNYGQDLSLFTARASYIDVINEKRFTRGVILDIDRKDTVARACCGPRCGNACQTTRCSIAFFHIVNVVGMASSIMTLNGFGYIWLSICIAVVWLCGPVHLILNANRKIIHRQLRYSGQPWFQLYLSSVQTFALMHLFDYNVGKLLLVVPPLLTSLISLTISDGVYILERERSSQIIDVLVALLWQVILLCGVRYNLFDGMVARGMIKTMEQGGGDVLFQNSSMFCGKAASIIVMLLSQIIFRIRHPEQAFSLRGHYSILSNKEWSKKEARHRIYRRATLERDVRSTKESLLQASRLEASSVQEEF